MKIIAISATVLMFAAVAAAQSGGSFAITQSVIAGGGDTSAQANFSITGTIGQAVAGGNASAPGFSISSGFWTGTLAPTAATVGVSGRVLDAGGNPLRN